MPFGASAGSEATASTRSMSPSTRRTNAGSCSRRAASRITSPVDEPGRRRSVSTELSAASSNAKLTPGRSSALEQDLAHVQPDRLLEPGSRRGALISAREPERLALAQEHGDRALAVGLAQQPIAHEHVAEVLALLRRSSRP